MLHRIGGAFNSVRLHGIQANTFKRQHNGLPSIIIDPRCRVGGILCDNTIDAFVQNVTRR
jgi:hypothetical protein